MIKVTKLRKKRLLQIKLKAQIVTRYDERLSPVPCILEYPAKLFSRVRHDTFKPIIFITSLMLWCQWLQLASAKSFIDFTSNSLGIVPLNDFYPQYHDVEPVHNVIQLASTYQFTSPEIGQFLDQTENAFYIQDENTLYTYEGDGRYYGTQFSSLDTLYSHWEPLTACFSCKNPLGCTHTVDTLFSISLSFTGVTDGTFSLFAAVTLSLMKGVKHTYRIADGVSCILKNGESGQVFIKSLLFDNSNSTTFIANFDSQLNRFRRLLTVTNRQKVKWAIRDSIGLECRVSTYCVEGYTGIVDI